MMQISNRLLGTLSGILGVLVVATLWVMSYTPAQTQSDTLKTPVLLAEYEDLTQLAYISIENQWGNYLFGRLDSQTYGEIQTDVAFVDQEAVASLYGLCAYLVASDTLGSEVEDLAAYGLSPASAKVSLLEAEGGMVLHIGDVTPDGNYRYLYVEGGSAIYLMDYALAEVFLKPKSDYLNIRLYPSLSGSDVLDVEAIGVEKADGSGYSLVCTSTQTAGNLIYFDMVWPITFTTERTNVGEKVLTPMANLEASDILVTPEAADVYGLDTPQYTLSLTHQGQTYEVLFGDSEGGYTYAMVDNQPEIYLVESDLLAFLAYDYMDVAGPYVFDRNITTLSQLTVSLAGQSYAYDITGSGDELTASRDGQSFDIDNFVELYMQLNELPIEGVAQETSGDVVLSITAQYRDGSASEVVELTTLDSRKCAVSINGAVNFFTYKSYVDTIQTLLNLVESYN